ncbi:MAG: zinc-binding dehydrogenase [Bacteroidota bacterium]
MKAYLLTKAGKADVLKIHEVEEPQCRADQVKICLANIGINYAEILSRQGKYSWAPKKPYIPGMEGMGVVEEVGSQVTHLQVGDNVIFGNQYGAYAEKIVVPGHMAFKTIDTYSEEENAAFLVNFITAWVALVELSRIKPSDTVLIQAAAGGVGTAAVQLAGRMGCEVIGLAGSDDKLELIQKLGATHSINYRTQDFEEVVRAAIGGVDVVLELVGGEVFEKSRNLLKPFGRIAVAGYASIPFQKWNPYSWWLTWKNAPKVSIMPMAKKSYSVSATHIGYLIDKPEVVSECYGRLKDFVIQHELKPVVGRVFDFDEIPLAHEWIESRNSVGKVVVRV